MEGLLSCSAETTPPIAKDYPGFEIVFEYCLPYESGRRPDVLLISKEQEIVLEFKQKFRVIHTDIDQTAAYARDIHEYHYESRNSKVDAILVLTATEIFDNDYDKESGIRICTKNNLSEIYQLIITKSNAKMFLKNCVMK